MTQDRRDALLQHLLSRTDSAPRDAGRIDPALLSRILAGMVFAQRPINAAGRAITERFDLGPRGAFILSVIDRGVTYPKDLAELLRIGRSLAPAALARLTDAGLITTRAGDDRRRSLLQLTPLGQQVTAQFRTSLSAMLESRLQAYSRDQIDLFAAMLLHIQGDPTE